ncbi:TRAF3-interacting protein 1 isoform X2 [Trichechus manatus latirostris]|uniref:TRAF3-interacting protein 1 n=1 Tax=Trichechus manatus latirostris TaxID=127582 RepID=A0A2Y9E405_TRIMA|nr:TRAF3-interacting protein 1 isoform X2 [Trichechus manatus latirostris]
MNASVVRRTQDALGKVIRRPPLTEKLLSKPPFRYLHDIITEVIRMTGFMKGLYTDAEMKSDNVKDKDAKISFLQKAIDVVVMVSGEPLSAKPARIVAGHEPERTNELLQMIGRCCLSKLSSEDAVKRVLAGERGDRKGRSWKPQDLDNRNAEEEVPGSHKSKEDRRNSEIKERSPSKDQKQKEELREESKPREKEKVKTREDEGDRRKDLERDKHREGERDKSKNRAKQERAQDKDRGNKDRDREAERETQRERKTQGGREKERLKERDKGRERDRDRLRVKNGEHSRDPDREKSREHEKLEKKSAGPGEVSKKSSDGSFKDSKAELETESSTRASRSLTTKTSKRRSRNSVEGDSPPSDAEGDIGPTGQEKSEVSDNSEIPNELSSSLRRLPRPGSARPAPPRVKRQENAEVLTVDRTGSGKAVSNVIVDSQNSDNEEDDQFVVEAAPQLSEMSEIEMVPAVELEEEEKHGGLVKKILETKKDYEKLQPSAKPGEKEKSLVYESAWKKEKDIVSKEIEKLRMSIQTLCKSALPLGKIMDYIQEDVDAMRNELQLWRSESRQHTEALHKEQSITDCAVEPLKAELAELEHLIKDQQDKICAVKANILRNEGRIQKMVYSTSLSSRR